MLSETRYEAALSQTLATGRVALLPFQLDGYDLAVEAACVDTVGGSEHALLREQGLPSGVLAINLSAALGLPTRDHREFIVLRPQLGPRLLTPVDTVGRLCYVSLGALRSIPPVIKENLESPILWGVIPIDDQLTLLIDPDALVPEDAL